MNANRPTARWPLLALALALAVPPESAAADTTPTSTVSQIKVVAKGTSTHRLYHGALWLDHDKERFNYRWGGEQCRITLSETQVSMLFAAMRSKYNVDIDFDTREHKGARYRCITGFAVRRG